MFAWNLVRVSVVVRDSSGRVVALSISCAFDLCVTLSLRFRTLKLAMLATVRMLGLLVRLVFMWPSSAAAVITLVSLVVLSVFPPTVVEQTLMFSFPARISMLFGCVLVPWCSPDGRISLTMVSLQTGLGELTERLFVMGTFVLV